MTHEYERNIELYGDGIGSVRYIEHMGTDLSVVNSARVSFGKSKEGIGEREKKLIRYLIEHRHTSTLEHCAMTFKFTVPLFILSQHHRHRTLSYNESSRRYTDVNLQFYEPSSFRTQHKSNRQASNIEERIDPGIPCTSPAFHGLHFVNASDMVKRHHKRTLKLYDDLLEAGVCREQARGVLPQNLYTEYYGTVNLNNLLKFIDLRTHMGAQWEIQRVADACLEIATDLFPVTVGTYRDIRS